MTEILRCAETGYAEHIIPIGDEGEQYLHMAFGREGGTLLLIHQDLPSIKIECGRIDEIVWMFGIPMMETKSKIYLLGSYMKEGVSKWEIATCSIEDDEYEYVPIQDMRTTLCGIYGRMIGKTIADALEWFMNEGKDIVGD